MLSWSKYVVELYSFPEKHCVIRAHAAHFLAIMDYEKMLLVLVRMGEHRVCHFNRKQQRGDQDQARKPTTGNGSQFRAVGQFTALLPISPPTGHRTLRSVSLLHHILSLLCHHSRGLLEEDRRNSPRCDTMRRRTFNTVAIFGLSLSGSSDANAEGSRQANTHRGTAQNERLSLLHRPRNRKRNVWSVRVRTSSSHSDGEIND